jgi:hypothetical protein
MSPSCNEIKKPRPYLSRIGIVAEVCDLLAQVDEKGEPLLDEWAKEGLCLLLLLNCNEIKRPYLSRIGIVAEVCDLLAQIDEEGEPLLGKGAEEGLCLLLLLNSNEIKKNTLP